MAVFGNRRGTYFADLDTAAIANIGLTTLYRSSCAVVVYAFIILTFPSAILEETRVFEVLLQTSSLSFLYPSFF